MFISTKKSHIAQPPQMWKSHDVRNRHESYLILNTDTWSDL